MKTLFMINNCLQLHVVSFGLLGKMVHNKSTNGLLNVNLCAIDYTMNKREATLIFKAHHDLRQHHLKANEFNF
jgi:hypothetical protein